MFSIKMMMMMTMIMIMFIIISTDQNMGILMVNASWQETESLHEYDDRNESKIKAVSGEDDSDKIEALVLEKFRVLLGLKTLHNRIKQRENGSPAPSPSPNFVEGEAPSPAPVPHRVRAIHAHLHHRPPRPRPMLRRGIC